eukprot:SAG11_NODE_1126_length_5765_cov_9.701553_3_plen_140_part_00
MDARLLEAAASNSLQRQLKVSIRCAPNLSPCDLAIDECIGLYVLVVPITRDTHANALDICLVARSLKVVSRVSPLIMDRFKRGKIIRRVVSSFVRTGAAAEIKPAQESELTVRGDNACFTAEWHELTRGCYARELPLCM